MKIQHLSVIFVIIIIPIILMLSYYISLQLDTVNMQTAYTTKQLNATKEAIQAFEINTVEWNEAYSENADSKRRDIMASINTFTTSFANSIGIGGANKENILPYIPAIACTLYDGYYIYSPAEVKEVIRDEDGVAVFWTETLWTSGKVTANFGTNDYDNYKGKLLYEYDNSIVGGNPDGVYKYEDKDGNNIEKQFTLNADYAKSTYEHILKPYSTYSARYNNGKTSKNEKIDITVNYTLDNYISIYGTVKGQYIKKSGYLIDTSSIPENISQGETLTEKIAWRWNESGEYTCDTYTYVYAEDNTKVYFKDNNNGTITTFQVSSTGIRTDLEQTSIKYKKIRTSSKQVVYQALNTGTIKIRNEDGTIGEKVINQEHFYSDKNGTETFGNGIELEKDYSAKNYYIESADFSTWVQNNLADIVISDMQVGYEYDDTLNIAQNKAKSLKLLEFYKVDGNSSKKIFNLNNNNPEDPDSVFVKHKNQVIKQALISNLNQAITSYSRNSEGEYSLPILTETDWNNVLGNVSIITFVQDIPIGMKYYNNYAIATSTQNKEYVNPDEIYLSKKGDNYYHLPECSELSDDSGIIGYRNIDYVVKSYEKEEDIEYYYKHSDIAKEACYYCLVQRDLYSSEGLSEQVINEHDKAYRIALARERCRNISEINSDDELSLQIAVTLNENYGEEPSKTTIYVPYQGQYGDLPEPTRRGHDFTGWFKDPEDSSSHNRVVKNTIVNRFDHELYAHWTTMKYWVTFDTNEGSYVEPIELAYGSLYGELPTPTKAGYTFKGWYTAESGGTEITAGTEVTIASNHTLYAHWTANTYQVELDANGGKFSNGNEKEYVDNTYLVAYSLSAETPTKTGYNFVGWYTAKSGGTRVFAGDQVVNPEPHTLYAHWESNKFTVTLYANGGKFSNGEAGIDIEVTYLELYPGTLSLQIPTREGYSFNGWKKEDGTQVIAGQQVTTLDSVLYADWTTNTCTVTYDACGGTITTGESTKTFTKGTSYVHPTPEKEGYEFDGWYTDQFGGNEVEYGALVSTTGELKLYAHWKAVYTVTYIAEGGANVPGAQEFQEGSSITLSSQHPTRDGYQFSGWTYNSSKYYPGETHTFGNSVTLYAIWNEVDVSGIEITNLSNNSWVKRGDTLYLSAKVYPENTLYRDVTWGTSNDSVASIDSYGWLTLKETGLVTITAKAGGVTTTVDIYVYNVFLKAGETLTTYKYSDIPEERPTTYYKAETGGMYIIAEQYYNSYYRIVNRNNNCIIKNHHNDSIYFDLNKEQLYGTIEVY